jgi:hypothetical protein
VVYMAEQDEPVRRRVEESWTCRENWGAANIPTSLNRSKACLASC